jgi:hypothetical protein
MEPRKCGSASPTLAPVTRKSETPELKPGVEHPVMPSFDKVSPGTGFRALPKDVFVSLAAEPGCAPEVQLRLFASVAHDKAWPPAA